MSANPEDINIWEALEAMSSDLKQSVSLIQHLQARVEMQERYIDSLKAEAIDMERRLKFLESGGRYPVVPVDDQ